MISGGNNWLLIAAAVALSSCAPSPRESPAAKENESAARPESRKPVRMDGRGQVSSVSLEDFFLLQQSGKAMVFDARLALFYQLGHIPGAINLPKNRCDEAIRKREAGIKNAVAEGKTIVVYCSGATCPDAQTVATHISGFGYPASVFSGGWDTWKEAGMPVE